MLFVFVQEVSQWLRSAPLKSYFRVNTLKITPQEVIASINEQLSKVMQIYCCLMFNIFFLYSVPEARILN